MPRGKSKRLEVLVRQATYRLAIGESWAEIANAVGRSVNTVRKWPAVHREIWSALWNEAISLVHERTMERVYRDVEAYRQRCMDYCRSKFHR